MATYGEERVKTLIKRLPKNEYRYLTEIGVSSPHHPSLNRYIDFVVISATLGVIVLEVKDWKKFKVRKDGISVVRPDGVEETEENPLNIARRQAENVHNRLFEREDLLRLYRGQRKLAFPYRYAVVLTYAPTRELERAAHQDIWREGEAIGKDDLTDDNFEAALQRIPSAWHLPQPLSRSMMDIIYASLNPEVLITGVDDEPIGILTRTQEEEIVRPLPLQSEEQTGQLQLLDATLLSSEAAAVIEKDSVRLVRGVAGSGKSLVLARRALYLAQMYPDLQVLVVAFNKDLVHHLQQTHLRDAKNIEVATFHSLCHKIIGRNWGEPLRLDEWLDRHFGPQLREQGMTAHFVKDEFEWRIELDLMDKASYLEVARDGRVKSLNRAKREFVQALFESYIKHCRQHNQISWEQIPKRALAYLSPEHPLYESYDAILLDEAQDFAPSWIGVVKRLLKRNGHLFMCDDPTQSLFRAYSWRSKGVEVTGRTRVLRVPFRCTREITAAAYCLVEADATLSKSEDVVKPDLDSYELLNGDVPRLVSCITRDREAKFVDEQVGDLQKQGVAAGAIAVLCHNRNFVKQYAHLRDRGVYVEHFDKMKGLEFSAVFIPHLQSALAVDAADDTAEALAEKHRRLYTAMTRARQTLIMTYHETIPKPLAILYPYVWHETVSRR